MKLEINDELIMLTALKKADESEWYEALRLFCRVDSYESELNKLGCLCMLRDYNAAYDAYRVFKSKYHLTHNCYADMKLLGNCSERIFCYSDSRNVSYRESNGDPKKLFADRTKVAEYSTDLSDIFDGEFDFMFGVDLPEDETGKNTFYEVNSPEHCEIVRRKMEKALKEAKSRETMQSAVDAYLDLDTDDIKTIESQMVICAFDGKYARGKEIAEKIADRDDAGIDAVCSALELLMCANDKKSDKTVLRLLLKALEERNDVSPFDLEEFVRIAWEKFKRKDIARLFAETLYKYYKTHSVTALITCVCAFNNCGDFEKAFDALKDFAAVMPEAPFSREMFSFLQENSEKEIYDTVEIPERDCRHMYVPQLVVERYILHFKEALASNDRKKFVLDGESIRKLSCLLSAGRLYVLQDAMHKAAEVANVVCSVLEKVSDFDKEEFAKFAVRELSATVSDNMVSALLIELLLESGYREKILVSCFGNMYALDLSQLKEKNSVFVKALCFCATLKKTDVKKLQQAYLTLKEVVDVPAKKDSEFKLAYALLAVCNKNFETDTCADLFNDGDDSLYKEYLSKL